MRDIKLWWRNRKVRRQIKQMEEALRISRQLIREGLALIDAITNPKSTEYLYEHFTKVRCVFC